MKKFFAKAFAAWFAVFLFLAPFVLADTGTDVTAITTPLNKIYDSPIIPHFF